MEDKDFILGKLTTNTTEFIHFIEAQSQTQFTDTPNGKWSSGQNLEHLIRSLAPVSMALLLPGFLLRFLFGKPNRKPRTYLELVERYKQKLAAGGRASGRFIPPPVGWNERSKKINELKKEETKMITRLNSWHEDQLDKYLLPHPLLGKLTLREMLFFSVNHIEHHHQLLKGR